MADPDPEISEGPSLKIYFLGSFGAQFGLKIRAGGEGGQALRAPPGPSLGSATEGSGPGRGKLEWPNVRAVPSQRFILRLLKYVPCK